MIVFFDPLNQLHLVLHVEFEEKPDNRFRGNETHVKPVAYPQKLCFEVFCHETRPDFFYEFKAREVGSEIDEVDNCQWKLIWY